MKKRKIILFGYTLAAVGTGEGEIVGENIKISVFL